MAQDFRLIGFGKYSSEIINILLGGDILNVKEIYSRTKIPKNKIYEVLDELQTKGLIGLEEGKPKKYYILNDKILDDLIENREKELEDIKKKITNLKESREKLTPSEISIIDSTDDVHKLIEYNNLSIKKEILSCSNLTRMYYGCFRTLKDAIDRGVKVKFIASVNSKDSVLKAYHDIGVEIRIFKSNTIFPKIGLLDKKYTRITITNSSKKNSNNTKTIWANSKVLYSIVKNHFDKIWIESIPYKIQKKN
jgi:HTH-type transcriptional regulator, sugar sensing transcriptional regulator